MMKYIQLIDLAHETFFYIFEYNVLESNYIKMYTIHTPIGLLTNGLQIHID